MPSQRSWKALLHRSREEQQKNKSTTSFSNLEKNISKLSKEKNTNQKNNNNNSNSQTSFSDLNEAFNTTSSTLFEDFNTTGALNFDFELDEDDDIDDEDQEKEELKNTDTNNMGGCLGGQAEELADEEVAPAQPQSRSAGGGEDSKAKPSSSKPKSSKKDSKPKKFEEVYQTGKKLGEGAFAEVKQATKRGTSESYAIKIVTKSKLNDEDEQALKDEIDILSEFHHKHIIRLYETFEDAKFYYLVTEEMHGGELFDRVVVKSYYNEKEARDASKIILEALEYCHSKHVAHRDLKPENLLLQTEEDDTKIKLADFGFAKRTNDEDSGLTTQCGTPGYVAPEILEGKVYGTKADVWSIGVITYVLLGGYPPFIEQDQRKLFRKIKKGEYEFHDEYWGQVSKGAKDLISSMLTVDPSKRVTATEALQNRWIGGSGKKLAQKDLGKNLEEFKKFNARRKFKAAVQGVVAANTVKKFVGPMKGTSLQRKFTEEDLKDLKETFNMYDKDGGGTISFDELQLVMKKLGQKVKEKELHKIIKSIDQNNDGEIDFDEFVAMMRRIPDSKNELKEAFKVFDADGSGTTSMEELKAIMEKFGQNLTQQELDAVMNEIDDDGDGEISFNEFKLAMNA